ncbi:MAG: TraR/DksA family transcriptional regulator [Acidobacteriota bacterium]
MASRPRNEKPAAKAAKPVPKPVARPVVTPAAEPVRAASKRVHPPTAREFEAMRESLQHKRQEMLNRYKRDLRVGQETSDDGTDDIVDRANNSYHRELMFSLSDTDRVQLLQIEAALKRSENGTFGKCVHCGQLIALQRLLAIPWARLCIDCQELAEKGMLED